MTNPYEPPKTVQQSKPHMVDFFVRAQKWQWRGFYWGILTAVICMILQASVTDPLTLSILVVLAGAGGFVVTLSLVSILPLAVWGFIKGYRESRRR